MLLFNDVTEFQSLSNKQIFSKFIAVVTNKRMVMVSDYHSLQHRRKFSIIYLSLVLPTRDRFLTQFAWSLCQNEFPSKQIQKLIEYRNWL